MHEAYQSFYLFCVPGLTQNSQEILFGSDYSDHGFFQKKVAPKGGLFREIRGVDLRPAKRRVSLLRSCCSCGGPKKRECRGGTKVRVVCCLSLNCVGFPPKNRKTNKDKHYIYIYDIHTQISIYIYVFIYICIHTYSHRIGDYIHYSRFCPFFIVSIFLQIQPK